MSKLGHGYGSEFHLMRLMGRYRQRFTRIVCDVIGASDISWLDFRPGGKYELKPELSLPDNEWKGIEFLAETKENREELIESWKDFWPQSGSVPNWDAIGKGRIDESDFWILTEVKAHIGEIKSNCGAISKKSKDRIADAMKDTQTWLNVKDKMGCDWLKVYYQYAFQLAMLYFLNRHNIKSRLLRIYLCGDKNPAGDCPPKDLEQQSIFLGVDGIHLSTFRVHEIFIDVVNVKRME